MTSRDIQAQNTRNKVLESARKLIGEFGYDNVTIDDIVSDCGVAKGTFYHYFKSKEDIVYELSESVYDALSAKYSSYESLPFEDRVLTFVTDWHNIMRTYNLHFARITVQMCDSVRTGEKLGANISHMDQGLALIKRILVMSVEKGELSNDAPIDVLSMALMFEMQGSTIYHCNHSQDFDVMGWNDSFINRILFPLLKPYMTMAETEKS